MALQVPVCASMLLLAGMSALYQAPAHRIVEGATGRAVDVETLVDRMVAADVVLIGEHHDSAPTGELLLELLDAVAGRGRLAVLALEVFERDDQEMLDRFQAGAVSEDEMLAAARPWLEYEAHYRPVVHLAVDRKWPVVAANVPRAIAADVARDGLAALLARRSSDRPLYAAELDCAPSGAYFDRFVVALGTHGETLEVDDRVSYYESQCLKDETMAESVARVHATGTTAGGRPLVIGIHGAVHVDYGLGTVERVVRRLPGARVVTATIVPTEQVDVAELGGDMLARADFVILVPQ